MMSFFGITDIWIWGAYVACFACAALCLAYYVYSGRRDGEADE
jgi:ABC-type multidrug transport system permease subunit